MNNKTVRSIIKLFPVGVLELLLALYLLPSAHQDFYLLILTLCILVNTVIFRVNYKILLILTAITIILATFCKVLDIPVLASILNSLAFILFALSLLKVLLRKIMSVYRISNSVIYF